MLYTKPALLLLCLPAAVLIFSPALWGRSGDASRFDRIAGRGSGAGPALRRPESRKAAPQGQPRTPLAPPQTPSARPSGPSCPIARAPGRTPEVSPPPSGGLVQMQFDNIELRDLIRFVSNIMGKNFIYDEALVKGRVTVLSPRSLTKDEVFRVFESVLNYFGFTVMSTPEAYKIVRSADAKGHGGADAEQDHAQELPPEERITTLVHPLEYTRLQHHGRHPETPHVARRLPGERPLGELPDHDRYRLEPPKAQAPDQPGRCPRFAAALRHRGLQRAAHERGRPRQGIAGPARGGEENANRQRKRSSSPPTRPSNSLLISAPPEDMKEIRRIVDEIDTFRPQVLVEAAIIEMSLNKTQTLGVEWLIGGSDARQQGHRRQYHQHRFRDSGGALVPLAAGIASNTACNRPRRLEIRAQYRRGRQQHHHRRRVLPEHPGLRAGPCRGRQDERALHAPAPHPEQRGGGGARRLEHPLYHEHEARFGGQPDHQFRLPGRGRQAQGEALHQQGRPGLSEHIHRDHPGDEHPRHGRDRSAARADDHQAVRRRPPSG